MDGPAYPVSSVDRALQLLGMLRETPEIRLSDAARRLGVANSTAHRLLAMLVHHGFVAQDPATKVYRAGSALLNIGLAAVQALDIRSVAHPFLVEIAEVTGETSHLAQLEGARVRYIDAVESQKALRVASRVGMTLPAHCTSVGKILLAELDTAALRTLLPTLDLPAETEHSITDRSELEAQLEIARQRGFAVNAGESEDGVSSVATAVRNARGVAVAAISCAAPAARLPERRMKALAEVLLDAAARLGARLTA